MITPVELDLHVQRHAPFPAWAGDNWRLVDSLTGMPLLDLTGATITTTVALYEGANFLMTHTHSIVNGPNAEFSPPAFTEAQHEALIEAPLADSQTLQSRLRLRYDTKVVPASGIAFIAARGFYTVQTGVTP